MKKVAVVMLIVLCFGGISFAQSGDTHSQVVYTYQTINSGGTYLTTNVPTTSIRPKVDKLVGCSVQIYNAAKSMEGIAALYDSTSSDLSGEVMNESEASSANSVEWVEPYLFPRYITDGVTVRQGPNTIVTIYFIRN